MNGTHGNKRIALGYHGNDEWRLVGGGLRHWEESGACGDWVDAGIVGGLGVNSYWAWYRVGTEPRRFFGTLDASGEETGFSDIQDAANCCACALAEFLAEYGGKFIPQDSLAYTVTV